MTSLLVLPWKPIGWSVQLGTISTAVRQSTSRPSQKRSGAPSASAARAEARAAAWDDYFGVLEDVLKAGPQGEPWSADAIETGHNAYRAACAATLMR